MALTLSEPNGRRVSLAYENGALKADRGPLKSYPAPSSNPFTITAPGHLNPINTAFITTEVGDRHRLEAVFFNVEGQRLCP